MERVHIIKKAVLRIALALWSISVVVSAFAQNADTTLLKVQSLPLNPFRPLHTPLTDMSLGLPMQEATFPKTSSINPRYIQSDFKHLLPPSPSLPFWGLHFQNDLIRGGSMVGLQYRTSFSDRLHLSVTPFLSNAYLRSFPSAYSVNAAINARFVLEVNDFISFVGVGQYSLYHGVDYGYNFLTGNGTYYGGYVQVRVIDDMYLVAGMERHYLRRKWVTSYKGGFHVKKQ